MASKTTIFLFILCLTIPKTVFSQKPEQQNLDQQFGEGKQAKKENKGRRSVKAKKSASCLNPGQGFTSDQELKTHTNPDGSTVQVGINTIIEGNVTIAPTALVCNYAWVKDGVEVLDKSKIMNNAIVLGYVRITAGGIINGSAIVTGHDGKSPFEKNKPLEVQEATITGYAQIVWALGEPFPTKILGKKTVVGGYAIVTDSIVEGGIKFCPEEHKKIEGKHLTDADAAKYSEGNCP